MIKSGFSEAPSIDDILAKDGILPLDPRIRAGRLARLAFSEMFQTVSAIQNNTSPKTVTHALLEKGDRLTAGEIAAIIGLEEPSSYDLAPETDTSHRGRCDCCRTSGGKPTTALLTSDA